MLKKSKGPGKVVPVEIALPDGCESSMAGVPNTLLELVFPKGTTQAASSNIESITAFPVRTRGWHAAGGSGRNVRQRAHDVLRLEQNLLGHHHYHQKHRSLL